MRFGLFIHWGRYAEPAGAWRGEKVPRLSEWTMHTVKLVLPPQCSRPPLTLSSPPPGTSYRHQIKNGTARVALHPVESLHAGLV